MRIGSRVRVVEPAPGYYCTNKLSRRGPMPWLLGGKGKIESPSINIKGEPVIIVRMDTGQKVELYEEEVVLFESGRSFPLWADDPDLLETMLHRVEFLNVPFADVFGQSFIDPDEIRMRVARLRGIENPGESGDLAMA